MNSGPDNLSAAFSRPDRSAGLAGKLSPAKPNPSAPPRRVQPASAPEPAQPSSSGVPAPPKRKPPTVTYMDASVRQALRKRAAADGITQTDVILDALDAAYGQGSLRAKPVEEPAPGRSLFQGRRRGTRASTEARVQVSVNFLADDLKVIENLVRETNAKDRSALIESALRLHLKLGR